MANYNDDYRCLLCETRHSLKLCRIFLAMPLDEKLNYVHRNRVCENCLAFSHEIGQCKSGPCRICWFGHHTLLHPADALKYEWMDMTALVWMRRTQVKEVSHLVRVLINPNAPKSYLYPGNLDVRVFRFKEEWDMPTEFVLTDRRSEVRTLTVTLEPRMCPSPCTPQRSVPAPIWDMYDRCDVADCSFYLSNRCAVVLGQDVAQRIFLGLPEKEKGLPYIQNTIFGLTFFGNMEVDQERWDYSLQLFE
ncbi:uncharacterized protein LOC142221615 [Haematobia irritans]|uniref:uncharacterized protein LOC142221615 n=1 Tax=Haematobia irritans TaxID=7368 RepID=UPI003F4F7840